MTDQLSVIVPYNRNKYGLVSTLINLQSQMVPPDRIVIIDTSKDKSGLPIAKMFTTNNIPIVLEVAEVHIYEAWNKGIELSPNHNVLIINDDLLMPVNFIDNLKSMIKTNSALSYIPLTPKREWSSETVQGFQWYSPVIQKLDQLSVTNWMPGFCFSLTEECIKEVGVFDLNYKVWFGDTDYETRIAKKALELKKFGIVRMDETFVYHYGGKSYKYQSKAVQKIIDKDRKLYVSKHKAI
jgi:GT2 family glycosyltransferase